MSIILQKNRIFKSLVSFLLVAVILFGSLVSCTSGAKNKNDTDGSADKENNEVVIPDPPIDDSLPVNERIVGVIENNKIRIYNTLRPSAYTLKYESESGVLKEYMDVGVIERENKSRSIIGFIPQNVVPMEAVRIGVYDSYGIKAGIIPIDKSGDPDKGELLYTFAALSDVHLPYEGSKQDFEKALNYLNGDGRVDFICICGDLTGEGTKEELEEYKEFVEKHSPNVNIYEITGNHENHDSSKHNDQSIMPYTGDPLFYTVEKGDDLFIMLGIKSAGKGSLFDIGTLIWLEKTVKQNKDKRCFLFQHVRPTDTSGNAEGKYKVDLWGGEEAELFEKIVKNNPNLFFFHGHSHQPFSSQALESNGIYDNSHGYHSFHIPSITSPRFGGKNGEGYIIEVYENGVLLRGRDFADGKFVPTAEYYIATSK
ncbi:MAG: metallophosphoesterase [Clostridia bacterium]|nr:metallophosphoesterase [Clostridia bacterium]